MATYKVVMRPALEYASSAWSPIASSTSINKLQVMQNAALRTATGCTGLAKFDWKVFALWATKYNNLVAQQ